MNNFLTAIKTHYRWILGQAAMALVFLGIVNLQETSLLSSIGEGRIPHLGFRIFWPLLVFSLAQILFSRWKWFFIALCGTAFSLVLIADRAYFSYFDTLPTLLSKIPLYQALTVRSSILNLISPTSLLPLGAVLGLWVFAFYAYRSAYFKQRVLGLFITGKVVGLVVFLTAFALYWLALNTPIVEHTHHENRHETILPRDHWGSRFSNLDIARVYGVLNYHVRDFQKARGNQVKTIQLGDRSAEAVRQTLDAVKRINATPSPLQGIARGYNVVIVQLEAVQYWLMGASYDGTEVMPFLNKLYRETLHWDRVYDITSIGRTSDAEFALHTGMWPDQGSSSAFSHTNKRLFTFGKALQDKGYGTFSFHGYRKDFWNRTNTHPYYGIQTMLFREDWNIDEKLGIGIPDKVLFPKVAQYLETVQQPFYAFLISLSCHHPYREVPEGYEALFPSISPKKGLRTYSGYLQLARYTDEALKTFYKDLEKRGLLDNTIFVVYGDHDFGQLNAMPNRAMLREHFESLEANLGVNPYTMPEDRIPLAIAVPSKQAEIDSVGDAYSATPGTLSDVFPTVFHLLGEEVPTGVMGAHLFQHEPRTVTLPDSFDHLAGRKVFRFFTQDALYVLTGTRPKIFPFREDTGELPAYDKEMATMAKQVQTINDLLIRYDLQAEYLKP